MTNKHIDFIERAESGYRHPKGIGRPRRKLVRVNRQYGMVCIQCQKRKSLSQFGFSSLKGPYFESMCRTCKNAYHRERRRKTH